MWDGHPASDINFSHDGKRAAYCRYPEHILFVSDAGGEHRIQLTRPPFEAYQPHWSPDGTQLAFMGRDAKGRWRVYRIGAAGGEPIQVEPSADADQGVPTWSADGRFLVFGELKERRPQQMMKIHLLDLSNGRETLVPYSEGKWSPRWSPDGTHIAAAATDLGSLLLYSCASQKWTTLVASKDIYNIDGAEWSLDGRYLYFDALTSNARVLYRVRVFDQSIERLLTYSSEFEYAWAGVDPNGDLLMRRTIPVEDIYALELDAR
jgi:Tol biopolymer transport system component